MTFPKDHDAESVFFKKKTCDRRQMQTLILVEERDKTVRNSVFVFFFFKLSPIKSATTYSKTCKMSPNCDNVFFAIENAVSYGVLSAFVDHYERFRLSHIDDKWTSL